MMLNNIGIPGLVALGVLPSFPIVIVANFVAVLPMPHWFVPLIASLLVEG